MLRTKSSIRLKTTDTRQKPNQTDQPIKLADHTNIADVLQIIKQFDSPQRIPEFSTQPENLLTPKNKAKNLMFQPTEEVQTTNQQPDGAELRLSMETSLGLVTFLTYGHTKNKSSPQWFETDSDFILILDYWKVVGLEPCETLTSISNNSLSEQVSKVILNSRKKTLSLFSSHNILLSWYNIDRIEQGIVRNCAVIQLHRYVGWVCRTIKEQYRRAYTKTQYHYLSGPKETGDPSMDVEIRIAETVCDQNPESNSNSGLTLSICSGLQQTKILHFNDIYELQNRYEEVVSKTNQKAAGQVLRVYSQYWNDNVGDL